jgi:hypothetical protein
MGNQSATEHGSKRWSHLWDYENRLSRAADRKNTVRYNYDATIWGQAFDSSTVSDCFL